LRQSVLVNNVLANVLLREGGAENSSEVEALCNKTLSLSPDDAATNLILGILAEKKNLLKMAEDYLDKARLNDRTNPVILADLGYVLAIRSTPDLTRAIDHLDQAYTLAKGSAFGGMRSDIAAGLALALIRNGEYERARDVLEETISRSSETAAADVVKTLESLKSLLAAS
jgi:Flp pilus assembly protein TadD